jgi:hypothetical protein
MISSKGSSSKMSATDRFYVAVHLNGCTQYYTRDSENMVNKRWTSVPQFVTESSAASPKLEAEALNLVKRLRSLKVNPWLVDMEGKRLDVPEDGSPIYTEDNRQPVRATLADDAAIAAGTAVWYAVRPANTVNGPKWFCHFVVPGRPQMDTVYADSPIAVLIRAEQLHFLPYGERAPAPEAPKPVAEVAVRSKGSVMRPGDRWK